MQPTQNEDDLLAQRIADRAIATASGCHEWQGYITDRGYGIISIRRRLYRVHRVVWQLAHGPIPSGMVVCHACDNRRCCFIGHLFLGNQAANMADMRSKGRASGPPEENRDKTHCKRGHEFTPDNTRMYRGSRFCRACESERSRAKRARRRRD